MDAELVSALMDLLYKVRVLLGIFPDQKEGSTDIVFCQRLKHLRCIFGVRTIVEGQGDLAT